MPTPADTWEAMEDRAGQYARRAEDAVASLVLREVDTQRAHALATVSLAYSRLATVRRDRAVANKPLYFIRISPSKAESRQHKSEFAILIETDGSREPMVFTDEAQALRTAEELHDEYPEQTYTVHPVHLVNPEVGGR